MTLTATDNPLIKMGGNMSPFDAHKLNIDDLFEQAEAFLNGEGVSSAAEADAVETLLDMARQAKKAADEARKTENEPFDTGKAEVQARYNPILKRADTIADTCKNVLTPWKNKLAAEKAAKAEAARLDAEKLRKEAEAAIQASAGNVAERERAEEKLALAKDADKFANKTAKAATTGTGLRTSYEPVLTDLNAAVKHYWAADRVRFEDLVCELARGDVRRGERTIPGFNIIEEKRAV